MFLTKRQDFHSQEEIDRFFKTTGDEQFMSIGLQPIGLRHWGNDLDKDIYISIKYWFYKGARYYPRITFHLKSMPQYRKSAKNDKLILSRSPKNAPGISNSDQKSRLWLSTIYFSDPEAFGWNPTKKSITSEIKAARDEISDMTTQLGSIEGILKQCNQEIGDVESKIENGAFTDLSEEYLLRAVCLKKLNLPGSAEAFKDIQRFQTKHKKDFIYYNDPGLPPCSDTLYEELERYFKSLD